jgi:hypothetical protein
MLAIKRKTEYFGLYLTFSFAEEKAFLVSLTLS